MNKNIFKFKSSGFSLIEIILSVALFTIFISGTVTLILQGYSSNQLGLEETAAAEYTAEGMDAMRSIRNQGYSNLTNTSGTGITRSALNVWQYSGANNTFDKYTRTISVGDVNRDGSGNIVIAPTGTLDPNTKKVTVTTSWTVSGSRNNSVDLISYLTNFRLPITAAGGLLIYGDGTTTPKNRTYSGSSDTFSAENSTNSSASGNTFILRTSPTKTEAIAGYVTATGVLNVMCYDGTTWTNEWNTIVGGSGTTRPFDISYETNSGKVMVLYSTNTASNDEMAYRTKSGGSGCGTANWTSATNLNPVRTTGIVQWVKMAWDKRSSSNLITAIWADNQSDLSAMVWNGTVWGNEPASALATSLQVVTSSQDVEDFDTEYESLSGDIMVVWGISVGNNTNGVRYSLCTGGNATCTWSGVQTPPTFVNDATHLDISANPNSDELVFASIGINQSDLQIGYWSGNAWSDSADVDTSCKPPIAGTRYVSTGWLISGLTARSIIRYFDQGSSAIDWYVGNGSTFTKQSDWTQFPASTNPIFLDTQMNSLSKDQLMSMVSDNANNLFAKRLVMDTAANFTWTNSDGVVLESSLPQAINSPFSFAYWRN